MRALISAGSREEKGGEERGHEPCKDEEFDAARRASNEQINRERCQRDNASEQTRCDKSAMPRRRQRVLPRRRVDERFDIIPYWREEAHGIQHTSGLADALPLFYGAIVSDAA